MITIDLLQTVQVIGMFVKYISAELRNLKPKVIDTHNKEGGRIMENATKQKNLRRLRRIATRLALTTKVIGGKTNTTLQSSDIDALLNVVGSDIESYDKYELCDIMRILSTLYTRLRLQVQLLERNSIENSIKEEQDGEKN